MELLLNSDGNVVVKDGKPVYKHSDGKEIPFDAAGATTRISELNDEAKGHRLRAKEFETKLTVFNGIDPEKAREAMTIVENLDAKKLVDAGKIDKMKEQITEDFKVREQRMVATFNEEKAQLESTLGKTTEHLFNNMVESEFFKSQLFTGKDAKTTMTPDVAYALFKNNFDVKTDGDRPRIMAKLDGEEILSRERPGEPATFHEALDKIWEKYPYRDRYEMSNNGGGGQGNHGDGGPKTFASNAERIAAGLRERSRRSR